MQSGERIVIDGRDYRLGSVLSTGTGSYGQVWAATDAAGRAVALKFINAEAMSQADPSLRGHWYAHMEREIVFLDSLNADSSRHIVTLFAHGRVDEQPVLVLERLDANLGQWLAQRRRDGAPPPDLARVLDWADQILEGLDVIHRAGFVYRDLKFSNLLVGDDGALLKLADFGSLRRENGDSTRSFIGTPATMAPEQMLPVRRSADGCEYAVDYRADYYALGLLLFILLTEQSTTVAQRRLGDLLALHGQEGAGQHRAELGGLSDEERELLRRSIEFWTVPVSTVPGGGAAAVLTDLIDRLLACDPIDRPRDSTEIRAVLDAARAGQPFEAAPALALAPDWDELPPVPPPNRRPHRATAANRSLWLRRTVGLAGIFGLAGVVAWAIATRPVGESRQDRVEPPSAVIASSPPTATDSPPPVELSSPPVAPAVVAPPPAAEVPVVAESRRAPTVTAESAANPTVQPATAPVAESTAGFGTGSVADVSASPVVPDDAESAMPPPEPVESEVVATPPPAVNPVTVERPASARVHPSTRERAVKVAPVPKPREKTTTVKATPAIEPVNKAAKATPAAEPLEKPVKVSPAVVEAVEKTVRMTPAVTESATVPPPVTAPPKAPSIAKPVPKAPAPAAPVARNPSAIAKAAPAPRRGETSNPVAHATRTPGATRQVSVPARPTVASNRPATRAGASTSAVSRPPAAPPTLPPIELESRPQTASSPLPPINLVSRSDPAPAPVPVRPARPTSATVPPPSAAQSRPASVRNTVARSSQPSRSADPITNFQEDASRAARDIQRQAEAVGNWASRTGQEIQRGLDSANQAVSRWTGVCDQANGCESPRVKRRDRWVERRGAVTTTRYERPASYDEDEGFAEPPPRWRP